MTYCPYCKAGLDADLDAAMGKLTKNPLNGEERFLSSCCSKLLMVYAKPSGYFLTPLESLPSGEEPQPEHIGHQ